MEHLDCEKIEKNVQRKMEEIHTKKNRDYPEANGGDWEKNGEDYPKQIENPI